MQDKKLAQVVAFVTMLEADPTKFKNYRTALSFNDLRVVFDVPEDEVFWAKDGPAVTPETFFKRIVSPWMDTIEEVHRIRIHYQPTADDPYTHFEEGE